MSGFCVVDAANTTRAHNIAQFLKAPCTTPDFLQESPVFTNALQLWVFAVDLQLYLPADPHPFVLDYSRGRLQHRLQSAGSASLLLRAMGKRSADANRHLWDLTGGFAEESVLLAQAGFTVYLIERSPIVFTMLDNALQCLQESLGVKALPLSWQQAEAQYFLQNTELPNPDIIYLDPMFPPRRKQAKVKKKMQVLQAITEYENIGADNLKQVLPLALQRAQRRVVVKRPRLAEPLAGLLPQGQVLGKVCRYDIYKAEL